MAAAKVSVDRAFANSYLIHIKQDSMLDSFDESNVIQLEEQDARKLIKDLQTAVDAMTKLKEA